MLAGWQSRCPGNRETLTWNVFSRLEMSRVSLLLLLLEAALTRGISGTIIIPNNWRWFILLKYYNGECCLVLLLCYHLTAGYDTSDTLKHELFYCNSPQSSLSFFLRKYKILSISMSWFCRNFLVLVSYAINSLLKVPIKGIKGSEWAFFASRCVFTIIFGYVRQWRVKVNQDNDVNI